MIGRSLPEYAFIRTSILGLRLIAPLSITYIGASCYNGGWLYSSWIGVYALVEASFYLLIYLPRNRSLQKAAEHPPLPPREEREALFNRCFSNISGAGLATGWFFSSPVSEIKRENISEWLLWAIFGTQRGGVIEEWEEELEGYVSMVETLLGRQLESGWNKAVRCMKVSLDPVIAVHRPFIWYMIVWVVDSYTSFWLLRHGFEHYSLKNWVSYFPPQLHAPFSRLSPNAQVSYWHRDHLSETKHAVLFFHGIGIGLWTYAPFLIDLIKEDPDVGIIAVENLSISMRISPPPLGRRPMLDAIQEILEFHSLGKVMVVGHSYGTITTAHMLKDPLLSPRISSVILVDPIPFLLHLPSVAFNFVYRQPRTANEWQLWYFASRDPDIARSLARHFFWSENILWKEDLENRRVGVILSGRDQIVDSREVWQYLTGEQEPVFRWEKNGLEVLFYPDLDHANVFDTSDLRQPIVEMVSKFALEESGAAESAVSRRDGDTTEIP